MNQTQFEADLSPLVRHAITGGAGLIAGVLAAHGYANQGQELVSYATGAAGLAAAYAGSVAWSMITRNKTVAAEVEALPFDEVNELANVVRDFRARGASPLLVAHTAQVLASLATAEAQPVTVISGQMAPAPSPVPSPSPSPVPNSPTLGVQTAEAEPPLVAGDPPVAAPPVAVAAAADGSPRPAPASLVGGPFVTQVPA